MIKRIAGNRTLGIFTLLFLIAVPAVSYAECEATLKWGDGGSKIEGYFVFGREEGQDYDYNEPWWQGDKTFSECTIDDLEEDKTYFFVIRAYSGDNVSADSNEVRFSSLDTDSDSLNNGSSSDAGGGLLSDSLSNGVTSDATGSSFHGSSGACFIGSLLDSE